MSRRLFHRLKPNRPVEPDIVRVGRRTKLTAETEQRIMQAIRAGNYYNVAANYAGITERTLYNWIAKGRDGHPDYVQFFQALKRAESEAEVGAVALVRAAARDDWRAAMTYLERRYPSRWGRRSQVDITMDWRDEIRTFIREEQLTPAEIKLLAAEIEDDDLVTELFKSASL